jgi:hypothetical protein
MSQQQQPYVNILETELPGPDGVVPNGHLSEPSADADDVAPVHLHAPDGAAPARTQEQERAFYQAAEPDILAGLFGAIDEAAVSVVVCTFPRFQFPMLDDGRQILDADGKPISQPMRVRFLKCSDADIEAAQRRATTWVANPDVRNGPRVERVDQAKMRSWIIYNSTVPEDKALYWDRKELVSRLRAGNGVEVVDRLLDAGEKLQAVNAIYGHSGLMNQSESEVERIAKP